MDTAPTLELQYVDLPNKETYFYREAGSSDQVLLLIHGNFTTSFFFETFMHELSKFYRVIAPDIRGYGHSTYNAPITSLEDLCDDLRFFMEAINIPKFCILGWSSGGAIAQLFVCKFPDLVEKLILVGSIGPRGLMLKNSQGKVMKEKEEFLKCSNLLSIRKMIEGGDKNSTKCFLEKAAFDRKDLPSDEILKMYVKEILLQRNIVDVLYALSMFNISDEKNGISEGTGQIKSMNTPCLLIHGSEDFNVFCRESWEIKRYLARRAEIEIIVGGRHFLFEPLTAKKVADITMNFLSQEKEKKEIV